ncbi:MAG: hypothetical protein VYE22_24505 [Myxococcota bacterium]|nr:hypothetical protein [Myxococcota bacterium]
MRRIDRILALATLATMVVACGGATESSASAPPDSAGGEAAPSAFEAALAAAVVPEAAAPEGFRVGSSTRSGGCTIPCGESGLGGQGPVIVVTPTDDPTYGYTQANPIRVGGVSGYHEERYLRGLWGPDGQPIRFERLGSCCPMPEGGLLDALVVHYEGLGDPVVLFLDAYHTGPLYVPVGFTGAPARGER